ncbi:putative HAD-like domain-containing protein [Seiridium cardinale]|uniref:HAD-like domain-containing protein n=1 Tax=Seiridium cardinale TaxID=138064 RepID=A0ABR2XXH2_9PEZI
MSIFLDFDGTITARDTIGELAKAALRIQSDRGIDLEEEWDGVVKSYMQDYDRHVDEYHIKEADRCQPEAEVEFLREMKTVELKSLDRINACEVFKGVSEDDLWRAGRQAVTDGIVKIRPGFERFVQRRVKEGWRIWVISVNWSTAFIEGVLDCGDIHVIANHVNKDGTVVGPEILNSAKDGKPDEIRNLTNSRDKLDVMKGVLHRDGVDMAPSFYFGDSITDLECLLHAMYGIVIADGEGEKSKLIQTLRRIGKDVPRANETEPLVHPLKWAEDFEEVEDSLTFGLACYASTPRRTKGQSQQQASATKTSQNTTPYQSRGISL